MLQAPIKLYCRRLLTAPLPAAEALHPVGAVAAAAVVAAPAAAVSVCGDVRLW
jgi:hypothetical protein